MHNTYLVSGHVHESLDAVVLGGLEEHVGAVDVVLRELEAVAERVVHVRLRREVHDGVDVLRLQNVVHEVGGADVALIDSSNEVAQRASGRMEKGG